MSPNWVVTVAYAASPRDDAMDRWEDALIDLDALVARVPDRGIEITLHCDMCTLDQALARARRRIAAVVPGEPVRITVCTEDEHLRSASELAVPELMSSAEIAAELGVSRQRVHQLRTNDSFPQPLADLRGGAVWDADAVRRFARDWARQPGRPAAVRRSVR